MKLFFWAIVAIALLVSGNATYEVLTGTVGTEKLIALFAALAIDAAAIWMGHHTTILAKLGDSTKLARAATWFIISLSLAVNYFHGYEEGQLAGGLVGIIFPLLAAILFEFFINHTIREVKRERGEILPGKAVYLKSRKYGDPNIEERIERLRVAQSYKKALARYNDETPLTMVTDSVYPHATRLVQAETTSETSVTRSETAPVQVKSRLGTSDISATQSETASVTSETPSLAEQVDQAIAEELTRNFNETATIADIVEFLVNRGYSDNKKIHETVETIKGVTSPGTIRTTVNRIKKNATSETTPVTSETGGETSK